MTKVKKRLAYRETASCERGREICYSAGPFDVSLRLKGTRTVVTFPWSKLFLIAAKAYADAAKNDKARARAEASGRTYRPRTARVSRGRL